MQQKVETFFACGFVSLSQGCFPVGKFYLREVLRLRIAAG